jgi:magnesium transporter
MNFEYMPELGMWWGYPVVLLIMLTVAAGMFVFFRKKKWL